MPEEGGRARGRNPGGGVMSVTAAQLTKKDEEERGALVERMFHGGIAVLEMLTIYVGDRLGLYRVLAQSGPSTAAQLARSAGTDDRYAREWLPQEGGGGRLSGEHEREEGGGGGRVE